MSLDALLLAGASPYGLDRQLLRTAFDGAPVGVGVCDEDGRFLEVNDQLCALLTRSRGELVGHPFLAFVHPTQRAASVSAYLRALAAATYQPSGDQSEIRCLTGAGESIWVSVTWTITGPDDLGNQYGIVHLRDITSHKSAERELAQIQRRLKLAFECAPIGIAVIRADGRLLQTNPALQTMLGYSSAELAALRLEDISHPDDRAEVAEVFAALMDGALATHDAVRRYLRSDGSIVFARRVVAAGDSADSRGSYILLQLEDVTGEQVARDELRERQLHDPLTKLATRESLAYELGISAGPRSLVVVELRELSRINGVLGPSYGDQVLVEAAQRLRSCCREADLPARLGGAELAILVDDVDGSAAAAVARRLATALATPMVVNGKSLKVRASIGSTADPDGSLRLDALLQRADLALHLNKADGVDPWTSFEPTMLDSSARQLALETDLRLALDNGDVAVVYQPIFDADTGELRGAETLSRWTHPTLGCIEPSEFTALAEHTGLMDALVAHTLRTACRDLARWRALYPERLSHFTVSVNVSPPVLATPEFVTLVSDCLIDADVPAGCLVIEVTETSLGEADPVAVNNAHELRRLGVGLALDDFGVGYSSLSRLARLPVTDIKLDRSFIQDVRHAEAEAPIIRAVLAMAAELGINVVVEGIETERQLELVRRYRCPQVQGFLLARPQPAAELVQLLARFGAQRTAGVA